MAMIATPDLTNLIQFNEIHLLHETQVVIRGGWNERLDVLNRGNAVWVGTLVIRSVGTQEEARTIRAFLSRFDGLANWAEIPTYNPTIDASADVTARAVDSNGDLYHEFADIGPMNVEVGDMMRADGRLYIVGAVDDANDRLVLDPQRPIDVGETVSPTTTVRARLVDREYPTQPQENRVWGPWTLSWREFS